MAQGVIDEGVYALLDDVVSAAAARRVKGPRGADAQAAEIGEGIRSLIASRYEEEWPLSRLAQHFGVSTFRLCRSFRKATGSTIHRYLLSVRLRASLERLESPKTDITALALDLGFSSHSHFSQTFGRSFRETPSACRQALAGAGA
jgi:AraC-like DNA-binding protein